MKRRHCALVMIVLSCAACAGLPPKQKPVQLSSAAPLDSLEAPGGGAWPDAQWWQRYQDATLDRLIELAVASSPTLANAHARFDAARQSVRVAGRYATRPTSSAGFGTSIGGSVDGIGLGAGVAVGSDSAFGGFASACAG